MKRHLDAGQKGPVRDPGAGCEALLRTSFLNGTAEQEYMVLLLGFDCVFINPTY